MTPAALAEVCQRALDQGREEVTLVVPRKRAPRGERVRLVPGSGRCPLGYLLNYRDGEAVGRFNVVELVAWMAAAGMVGVRVR